MHRRRVRWTSVAGSLVAAAAVVGACVLPAGAAPSAAVVGRRTVSLGFDSGACPGNGLAAVAKFQGAPIRVGSTALDPTSWATMSQAGGLLDCWAARPSGLVVQWALPLIPATGASMAQAAAGAYDAYWKALGTAFVQGSGTKGSAQPAAFLRIGWEFNGDWQPWAEGGTAASHAQFISAWRHAVTALRSVPGQRFTIVWNPNVGTTAYDARAAYPGDAYVDLVGIDDYDQSYLPATYPIPARASAKDTAARQARSWQFKLTQPAFGYQAWAAFAAKHHKKIAVCEWGLLKRTDAGGHGGGDDATYVHSVFAWARGVGAKHQLSYLAYLDQQGAYDSRLNTSGTKSATAAYRAEAKLSGR